MSRMNTTRHTDKYFLRSQVILRGENINPLVCYQIFARQDKANLSGLDETIEFILQHAPSALITYKHSNNDYIAGQPILKIEGRAQELIALETIYLSILSGRNTKPLDFEQISKNAQAIVAAANGKPVYYFGARHYGWWDDSHISGLCKKAGFAGCSTDRGAVHWNAEGRGTIPHALVLILSKCRPNWNATVLAARLLKQYFPDIPAIALIDTFNREISDSRVCIGSCPFLAGVRIDTCGENIAQGATESGVSISAVRALSQSIKKAYPSRNIKIMVSSGFDAGKIRRFEHSIPEHYDSIGTGSLYPSFASTSDIVRIKIEDKGEWLPLSKAGRREISE